MKFRNIFLAGLSAVALASCSDYLDVDAPSKIFPEEVYTDTRQMNIALNGVYASMLTGDTYGKAFLKDLCFNTDVDFATSSDRYQSSTTYRRYECDADAGAIKKAWDALYKGIERANMFISGVKNSELFSEEDPEIMQLLGEGMVLRAIFYHDLVWYFGDVPYSRVPSYEAKTSVYDIADRTVILDDMIQDLIYVAPFMKTGKELQTVEKISREMAWSMIVRLSMTAGGYSLRPEGGDKFGIMKRPENYTVNGKTYDWTEFYDYAIEYGDKMIQEGGHDLNSPFYEVFVRECNHESFPVVTDDVIFEIPFGQESSGSIGYIHGPKMDNSSGATVHNWGKADASAQLNAAYRYMFEEGDSRRDYVNQLFGYDNQGKPNYNNGRTVYNGKWSKLWNRNGLGAASEDNTGFNYPYMRYADVLLMYAEALNERNDGPTQEARNAVNKVRNRAFNGAVEAQQKVLQANTKEEFQKLVLDERKFEFAGENMRWRDLVRNNMLNEVVYWAYMRYFDIAMDNKHCNEEISEYDFGVGNPTWASRWVSRIYYHNNYPDGNLNADYTLTTLPFSSFPQSAKSLKIAWVINPYGGVDNASNTNYVTDDVDEKTGKKKKTTHKPGSAEPGWYDDNSGLPKDYILYSLRGYINCDEGEGGEIKINNNGVYQTAPEPESMPTFETLPVIRYILPYPRSVITRSMGKYENKYGYL